MRVCACRLIVCSRCGGTACRRTMCGDASRPATSVCVTRASLTHGIVAVAQSEALMRERLRSNDGELRALRDQVSLLNENIDRLQKAMAKLEGEKEDIEYQWGAAKAQLAKSEGDSLTIVVRAMGVVCVCVRPPFSLHPRRALCSLPVVQCCAACRLLSHSPRSGTVQHDHQPV